MKTIKMGIFGLGRGGTFYQNVLANNAEIVAVCDRDTAKLEQAKKYLGQDLATYTDFDAFIDHKGLEAVFLCNYFHQHAPFAIKALEKDLHVLSECGANGTMAEGVALVRAAEKSKGIYALAENYPYMKFNQEMKRIFDGGTLGKVLFAEGEYNHPVDPADLEFVKTHRPYAKHWRNFLPRSYYVTHSLAPLMYITGATPVRVTAMPVYAPFTEEGLMGLAVGDRAAIITCLNDDDSVFRVTGCAAFGAHENSYRICGTKGQAENIRGEDRILLRYNKWEIPEGGRRSITYTPEWQDKDKALIEKAGHGGGDFLVIREFLDCIRGGKKPVFDVYAATAMSSVGILSHRSLQERGVPYDIPDFRLESDRVKYENDTLTPFWGENGEAPTLIASSHKEDHPSDEKMAAYDALMEELKKNSPKQ